MEFITDPGSGLDELIPVRIGRGIRIAGDQARPLT